MNEKIGIVATSNISVAGGYARVVRDLINGLNILGKKVYLLTTSPVNYKKIEEYHGPIKLEKLYKIPKLRKKFCKEDVLSRRLIKKEFQEMLKEVDLIIDIDGKVLHNYIPKKFDKEKYIIWRVSCAYPDTKKFPWMQMGFKRKLKEFGKNIIHSKKDRPSKDIKIYPLDEWTKKELIQYWNLNPDDFCLYPEIKVDEFLKSKKTKKNQIVVFGRIAPNKMMDDSIKIFAKGSKKFKNYNLVVLGGSTPDSKNYISYLKKIVNNLGIKNRVEIIENPSFEKLKNVLLESKILIDSQREVSLTMTAMEALAAEDIVLAYKNSGTYQEILDKGKYGFGFMGIEEGSKELEKILNNLKNKKISGKKFSKRINFFSHKMFIERLRKIINGN